MQIVVIECECCEKEFETEDNSQLFDEGLCRECFVSWPVYVDCDLENKI